MRKFSVFIIVLLVAVLCANYGYAQLLTGYTISQLRDNEIVDEVSDADVRNKNISASIEIFEAPLTKYSQDASLNQRSSRSGDLTRTSPAQRLTGYNDVTAATGAEQSDKAPVDLQADNVSYNEDLRVVTASGNVVLVQEGRILRADEINYFLNEDKVHATGNVVLNEVNGDIHLAQEVELRDKMKDGFVAGLHTYLNDGSRFTAEHGDRIGGSQTVMSKASYTACEPCESNPDARLPWRLRAAEVTHDEEDARISYEHARFEVFGVPVAYTPYFSHSDGSVKRKSGFLAPSFGYSSDLGAFFENSYYWDIAPDKDMTVGLMAMTDQAPLGLLEWRQRWESASLEARGGITSSDYTDRVGRLEVQREDEVRGHIEATGLWDMNENWRSGFDVAYVSDDQYPRQYDIFTKDVLENTLYAERFDERDYAIGQVQAFQDTRIGDLEADQPKLLPELYASFIGDAGEMPLIKGRWDLEMGMLNLFRDGNGQDMNRASINAGWERRFVSDFGLVADLDASLRGDLYHVNDRTVAPSGSGRSGDSSESRLFPQVNMKTSYPMARPFENMQVVVEPLAALTVAPEITDNNDIPNEDSRNVQIDASNLFDANRFPGLDKVEDQTRATYGMLTGAYGHDGSSLEAFVGQSYRFDNENNPFANGSGLEEQTSDIVGYVNGNYANRYRLGYRFQYDSDTFASSRHELDAFVRWRRLTLSSNYLYASALEGTELDETREQIQGSMAYYLDEAWQVRAAAVQDLGVDPGLRRLEGGLDYFGQCVFLSLTGIRSLTDDASGDSSTDIIFRIGLKNISEFETSGLRRAGRWE